MKQPAGVNRWRARQSEAARKRRGTSPVVMCIWSSLLILVILLLVLVIKLLFTTAQIPDVNSSLELDASFQAVAPFHGGHDESVKPNVEEMLRRIRVALAPFQRKYLTSIGEHVEDCSDFLVEWEDGLPGFLKGCPGNRCEKFNTLEEAKAACERNAECGGVTLSNGQYQTRRSRIPRASSNDEASFTRTFCDRKALPEDVWESFRSAAEEAMDDKSLHLDTTYRTKEDKTIYLSISSYRDRDCPYTLKSAFQNAKYPERLSVGIVQQNCNVQNCMTGTGWAEKRRWVPQDGPDVDCVEKFCELNPQICERQIRILRLGEAESYGPFFSRFLNSKLYRGENFYVQIDAHTSFRQDWDDTLLRQMMKTPSYPYSVISNYPPSGEVANAPFWPAFESFSQERTPSALCGATFEKGFGGHHTVRLRETSRKFLDSSQPMRPRHSCFVAAGFFIAHGSYINHIKQDYGMPYLFMGEEIALTIRFWTHGYDVYGPSVNVLKHFYTRKESPKFWETVNMVFDNYSMHNGLTDLIIPRVQRLVGYKDVPAQLDSVYSRLEEFGNGKVRTSQQFVQNMNIQIKTLQQVAPSWCLKGIDQPESTSRRADYQNPF